MPHVVEPALGTGRVLLAMLYDAYDEEEVNGRYFLLRTSKHQYLNVMSHDRKRTLLRLHPDIAPYKVDKNSR
jgi:glycyl-tRNA synthetase